MYDITKLTEIVNNEWDNGTYIGGGDKEMALIRSAVLVASSRAIFSDHLSRSLYILSEALCQEIDIFADLGI